MMSIHIEPSAHQAAKQRFVAVRVRPGPLVLNGFAVTDLPHDEHKGDGILQVSRMSKTTVSRGTGTCTSVR